MENLSYSQDTIRNTISESIFLKQQLLDDNVLIQKITDVVDLMVSAFSNNRNIFFAGNGGSASDAQHLAAEFVSRYELERPGLSAYSLSTDTSILTAIGNDYGYEHLFSRQLQSKARPGDIFFGITTSGKSKNILNAFDICRDLDVISICMCGQNAKLNGVVDHILSVPSTRTARIQECHILIGHIICGEVERRIFSHLYE